ncbi:MAG: hypothetical protein U0451_02280 [Candidatus Saccharimonadales bacterium]
MVKKTDSSDVSGWIGWIYFGGLMMMLLGSIHIIAGLVALFDNDVILVGKNNVWLLDITAWGWVHLIAGIIVLMAGLAVMSGKMWGRVVGIVLGVLAAIANFAFIPVYPLWSILMFTLCVIIVFALVAHGAEAKDQLE